MQLAILRANYQGGKPLVGAPAAAWNFLTAGIPVLAPLGAQNTFTLALPGPALLPSVLGQNVYEPIFVNPNHFLWDARTVGYGLLADILNLPPGNLAAANDLVSYSATRAQMLHRAYDLPNGPAAPGPVPKAHYQHIEQSERVVLSFLMGQTIAMRSARIHWGVPRLFHRSLYGPVLGALCQGAAALAPGLSPDFVCFMPAPNQNGAMGICLVEAKGSHLPSNPFAYAADRGRINKAFRDQIKPTHDAIVGGALSCAVSIACQDALLPNRIVAQFWDPPNDASLPVNEYALYALTAHYFKILHSVLQSLPREANTPLDKRVAWRDPIMRMRVEMDHEMWNILTSMSQGAVSDRDFYEVIKKMDATYVVDDDLSHNGDGLYLSPIDDLPQAE
jgi:hypothetical protein